MKNAIDSRTKEVSEYLWECDCEEMKGFKPVSTSTIIFHEIILPNAEIRFWRKRINFLANGKQNDKYKSGQMDSMIIIFDGRNS